MLSQLYRQPSWPAHNIGLAIMLTAILVLVLVRATSDCQANDDVEGDRTEAVDADERLRELAQLFVGAARAGNDGELARIWLEIMKISPVQHPLITPPSSAEYFGEHPDVGISRRVLAALKERGRQLLAELKSAVDSDRAAEAVKIGTEIREQCAQMRRTSVAYHAEAKAIIRDCHRFEATFFDTDLRSRSD